MTEIAPNQTDAEVRRRKVRKGTHSCWECRRRKIRCQYGGGDDTICLPCQARGSICRSQEFVDSQPPQLPDRRLAQRLARLEDLMAKVVDRVMPESGSGTSSTQNYSRHASPTTSNYTGSMEDDDAGYEFDENSVDSMLLTIRPTSYTQGLPIRTRSTDGTRRSSSRGQISRNERISQTLYSLFPSQQDVDIITKTSIARFWVVSLFSSYRDQLEGKFETPDSVSLIPSPNSHPTVLSKRLLQLCICLYDHPGANPEIPLLQMQIPPREQVNNIISIINQLVTTNDDLIATAEGLQTLVLLGHLHSTLGNLRKSWLIFRRAISLAILLGIDRSPSNYLKYVDPSIPLNQRPTPQAIWYRINAYDRFVSLILSLPVGSQNNSFASEPSMTSDTQQERLGKLHTVLARRILERERIPPNQINSDLDNAARSLGQDWWSIPCLDSSLDHQTLLARTQHLFLQINHFNLKNILHLPYLTQPAHSSPEYISTCLSASREILKRFIIYRSPQSPLIHYSFRQPDYAALISSLTLLLRYLYSGSTQETIPSKEIEQDKRLLSIVLERMQHLGIINDDKILGEGAEVIEQMMSPGEFVGCGEGCGVGEGRGCIKLNLPYFGVVGMHRAGDR
ncbi:transcription factor sdnS, partial [Podospora fimiseda]